MSAYHPMKMSLYVSRLIPSLLMQMKITFVSTELEVTSGVTVDTVPCSDCCNGPGGSFWDGIAVFLSVFFRPVNFNLAIWMLNKLEIILFSLNRKLYQNL